MTLQTLINSCKNDDNQYMIFYSGNRVLKTYTFDDIFKYSSALAYWLKETKNVKYKDTVMIKLGNSDITLLTYLAVALLGAVSVPIDPQSTDAEIAYIKKDSEAKIILEASECNKILVESLPFHELQHDVNENDLAFIVYTSGTTSSPKGVMLTHKNIISNALSIASHHNLDEETKLMSILPLFHVNALNFSFIATLYSKSTLVLNRSFYLPNFWDIASKEKVNIVSAVPKIIRLLLHDTRDINLDLSNLNYFTSAAAPLSIEDAKSFYEQFSIKILQGYGMSEAVNFSLTMPTNINNELYAELLGEDILSVGIEIKDNQVCIMDKNDNKLFENEIGEVCIQGANVMLGYLNKDDITLKTIKNGWLHTGDRGYFRYKNNQKFFYLTGREKELIIKNGENISPIELDSIITKVEGLENSVTVGFPNKYSGEEIGLVIVANEKTLPEDRLMQNIKVLLGKKKAPVAIMYVDELPVTATGKIQRLKLAKLFTKFQDILF